MTPRKQDVDSMSGAYALHALNEDETRQFEAHLAESEATRNEVTELTDTAVLLGLAVDPVTPPASLKQGIMAQLASTPQLPREVPVAAPVDISSFNGKAAAKAQARWFSKPLTALASVAAAVVLIVGGGVVANTVNDTSFQQAQANQLAAIGSASDTQRVDTKVDGGGSATLMWSGELASAAFMVSGLEELPSDRVYELWYIGSDGPRAAGTFTIDDEGNAWRVLDGEMKGGDVVGVTIEPSGGSKTPTTDPVISIEPA
ncbi:anti-sigma factor [Salinibacterium sp. G-O1]|uniref:anti-sigma factor n=1 Tax=Salinibacterium sp. G-O1 TaxID=3046208 RepID=UPI0024B9D489|nr:anti-sigma factor [Salinibacterium sp. G-O1]MDJ0335997.1 anti-sigma factor [Salinibacterium sp. G-O1]